jgi:hypothetical protein
MPDLRRLVLPSAAAGLLLAAPAAAASPEFTQTFELGFAKQGHTQRAPGAKTGIETSMEADDPGEPNSMPRRVARLEITFPRGMRFDTASIPRCSAATVTLLGAAGCPAGSRLGGGSGTVRTGQAPPGTPGGEFTEAVTLFNARRGIVFLFAGPTPVVLTASLSGRRLILTVPPAPVALARLNLRIGAHGRWAVTPRTCPASGRWKIRAKFRYTDGSAVTRASSSACARR